MQKSHKKFSAAWTAAALLALCGGALAGCSQAAKTTDSSSASQPGTTASQSRQPPPVTGSTEADESGGRNARRIVSRVLRMYSNGLEMTSPSAALDMIDRDRFYDYPRFEEELTRFLRSLGEVRVFVRETSVQMEGNRAVMIVDVRMVFASRLDLNQRGERSSQITFDFQRTDRGWKITEINPREFFLP